MHEGRPQTRDVGALLRPGADIVLVVPPFAYVDRPAIGVHLLQGVARRAGLDAQILYANLLFAAFFDEPTHTTLSKMAPEMFLGERIFARTAYGVPALGRDGGEALVPRLDALRRGFIRMGVPFTLTLDALRAVEARVPAFLDSFVPTLARHRAVGCSSSFEQNAAAIAILNRVKDAGPDVLTLMGGANCEAEMADGVRSLTDRIDVVFSGESEETFRAFAEDLAAGRRPAAPIVRGAPCTDLDALPTPDYADYYAQLAALLPDSPIQTRGLACLTYETSRGCWWGAKSHCTFCGLNGQGMASREKSPDRVIAELKTLLAAHPVADAGDVALPAGGVRQGHRDRPTRLVVMTDNIMPHAYFRTLLPRLADEVPRATLMYEMKANLTLARVRELVAAGVTEIQPGIEALSTGLLRLMAKGTTAAQNLALLRYAGVAGMYLYWNLLVGFPGDELSFYTETLELLPLVPHLQPPVSVFPVVFDRFSPYFDHAEHHGVRDLRPMPYYRQVLPETAAIDKIAYHFDGTCETAARAHPDVVQAIAESIGEWRRRYYGEPRAELRVTRRGPDAYEVTDRRGLAGQPETEAVDDARAEAALVARPARGAPRAIYDWALARRLVVERDGRYVPLALADADLLAELEARPRPAPALRIAT
jgi:Radical SAM superfamily